MRAVSCSYDCNPDAVRTRAGVGIYRKNPSGNALARLRLRRNLLRAVGAL